MPGASAGAGRDGVEQVKEIALAILREDEDLLYGVYCPSKDNFLCASGGVAFEELIDVDCFFPCSVVLVVGRKRSSMAQKICRAICRRSVGPPWTIPMKSARYT